MEDPGRGHPMHQESDFTDSYIVDAVDLTTLSQAYQNTNPNSAAADNTKATTGAALTAPSLSHEKTKAAPSYLPGQGPSNTSQKYPPTNPTMVYAQPVQLPPPSMM